MSPNTCELCPAPADYRTIQGGWYLCKDCITTGRADGVGA